MTSPAPAVRRTVRPAPVVVPVPQPVPGHPGCYWDWECATWVTWVPVPQPRAPRE